MAIILTVYLMGLTVMPCTDIHADDTNSISLEISEQSHNQVNDLDLCSPFCFCHRCQTLSFPSFYNDLLFDVAEVAFNITFIESEFSSSFIAIWRPPKI